MFERLKGIFIKEGTTKLADEVYEPAVTVEYHRLKEQVSNEHVTVTWFTDLISCAICGVRTLHGYVQVDGHWICKRCAKESAVK